VDDFFLHCVLAAIESVHFDARTALCASRFHGFWWCGW
jgi:hypothetical protein